MSQQRIEASVSKKNWLEVFVKHRSDKFHHVEPIGASSSWLLNMLIFNHHLTSLISGREFDFLEA